MALGARRLEKCKEIVEKIRADGGEVQNDDPCVLGITAPAQQPLSDQAGDQVAVGSLVVAAGGLHHSDPHLSMVPHKAQLEPHMAQSDAAGGTRPHAASHGGNAPQGLICVRGV